MNDTETVDLHIAEVTQCQLPSLAVLFEVNSFEPEIPRRYLGRRLAVRRAATRLDLIRIPATVESAAEAAGMERQYCRAARARMLAITNRRRAQMHCTGAVKR